MKQGKFEKAMSEHRIAQFAIPLRWIKRGMTNDAHPDAIHALLQHVFIIDARHDWGAASVVYTGYSPLFDVAPEGQEAPYVQVRSTHDPVRLTDPNALLFEFEARD